MTKNCRALFEEYQSLVAKTYMVAQDVSRDKPLHGKYIKPEDLMRRGVVAKELVQHCEDYFKNKPGEWFEIKSDARD